MQHSPATAHSEQLQGREGELQDWLNAQLYHPLAKRIAVALAATPVTPNMVSVSGGICVVLAGLAYVQPAWPWSVMAGLLLHMFWHVLDGADGDLARLTGRSSPAGEIVDGICDYASHFVLYMTVGLVMMDPFDPMTWIIGYAAGFSRIAQASYYESLRRQYIHLRYGRPWIRTEAKAGRGGALSRLGMAYLCIVGFMMPHGQELDAAAADPHRKAAMAEATARHAPAMFAGTVLLGANYRTIALGVSMLLGTPLYYFIYEAVVLNLLLMPIVLRNRALTRAMLAEASA